MVSRMVRSKGVIEFLKAGAAIRRYRPDVTFLLVGGMSNVAIGDDVKAVQVVQEYEIKAYSQEVQYLGQRSDVPDILALSDVFVLPSYYREGIPRVLLEACAVGLPIVTTDMPGCRDVVQQNANGFVVPPRDDRALVAAIERLLANPRLRREMGAAASEFVREHFDLDTVAAAYMALYAAGLESNSHVVCDSQVSRWWLRKPR